MGNLLYAPEHKPKHPDKEWGKTVKYEGIIPRIEKAFLKKDSKKTLQEKMPEEYCDYQNLPVMPRKTSE
jgi:hypothetical protein